MWRQREQQMHTEGEHLNLDEPWPCAETLKTLAELNEQCLALLAEESLAPAVAAVPMLTELGDLWSRLDINSRRRAATCPFLLVDVGFAEPSRWRWVSGQRVADGEPATYTAFFTVPSATRVAHQIFTNAWYIARTQPIGAALYLGMPAACVGLLRACTMRQIAELANQHAGWLRPRWPARTSVWRELLTAALSGDGLALEKVRMHGVQLLAMELRALEQVNAPERR